MVFDSKEEMNKTEYRFLVVGVINTLIGLSIIYTLLYFTNLSELIANIIGYSFCIIISFMLNKFWTFNVKKNKNKSQDNKIKKKEIFQFIIIYSAAFILNIMTLNILTNEFYLNIYISQVVGMLLYTAIVYTGTKKIFIKN